MPLPCPCIILILLQRERLALILSGREIKTVVSWTGENVIYGMPLAFIKQFQQYIDDLCSRLGFSLAHLDIIYRNTHGCICISLLICAGFLVVVLFDAVVMCIVLIGRGYAIQMCQKWSGKMQICFCDMGLMNVFINIPHIFNQTMVRLMLFLRVAFRAPTDINRLCNVYQLL